MGISSINNSFKSKNQIRSNVDFYVLNVPDITKNIEVLKQLSQLKSNNILFDNNSVCSLL